MRLPQPAAAKGKKVSFHSSSSMHQSMSDNVHLFCIKIHVYMTYCMFWKKSVKKKLCFKISCFCMDGFNGFVWCSLIKNITMSMYSHWVWPWPFTVPECQHSCKFKSLTGHLYCKTIEQIVHSFTHAYINCFYTL